LADFADKRDSQCLEKICDQVKESFAEHNLKIRQVVTDTGYSSGEALRYCEENNIDAYIPNFGRYKPEREGFNYNAELDQYECQRGNKAILPIKNTKVKNGDYYVKRYSSSKQDCKNCPFQKECCGEKMEYKKLDDSVDKEYYDRMHKKLTGDKIYAKRLFRSRASTVEPVLGTLINHFNMKRVNTRGIKLATKHVLMAALVYNLKKFLRFINKGYAANLIAIPVRKGHISQNYHAIFDIYFLFLPIYQDFGEIGFEN
jgi:hypothetical protein